MKRGCVVGLPPRRLLWSAFVVLAAGCSDSNDGVRITATPIEHVIVVIGENRSFDALFATYEPPDGQQIWNLRSLGIVDANGQPGPNFALAAQQRADELHPLRAQPDPRPGSTRRCRNRTPPWRRAGAALREHRRRFAPTPGSTRAAGAALSRRHGPAGSAAGLPLSRGPAQRSLPDHRALPAADPRLVVPESRAGPADRQRRRSRAQLLPDVAAERLQRLPRHAGQSQRVPVRPLHLGRVSVGWAIGRPPTTDQGTAQGGIPMGFYNMAQGDLPYFREPRPDLRDQRQLSRVRDGRHDEQLVLARDRRHASLQRRRRESGRTARQSDHRSGSRPGQQQLLQECRLRPRRRSGRYEPGGLRRLFGPLGAGSRRDPRAISIRCPTRPGATAIAIPPPGTWSPTTTPAISSTARS